MVQQITFTDSLVSFFYVMIFIGLIQFLSPKTNEPHVKYFKLFFYSKIFYGIVFVLIHSYYYRGGDTFLYFAGGRFFYEQILANPANSIELLFSSFGTLTNVATTESANYLYALRSNDVYYLSKIIGVINLFTGANYLASSIIFTILTAIGIWYLYRTICKLYPQLSKYLAIGILFYPSIGIWGSGILKDPLTFASVGFIFHSFYNLSKNQNIVTTIILVVITSYICFILKPYILYTFIPVMLFWLMNSILAKANNPILKYSFAVILVPLFAGAGYLAIQQVSSGAGKYSLENAQSVAEGFHSWHTYLAETRDQSGYSLGDVEFTATGVLRKAPESFFVTYFRPFIIGDVRNVATLFEALQALALLLTSIYVFVKVGIAKSFQIIFTNKDVSAFFLFAIVFGVTVGLTSYNFGALSRYKIPGVPFYVASISIIYYLGYLKPKGLMR